MNDLYDGLLEELECKICLTYMSPPIRQCETGHSICSNCKSKLPHCPLCQGQFTESRNISLEALARKMHYPCINIKAGCKAKLTLNEREEHEQRCMFREYKCAYSKCPWSGKYQEILSHWLDKKQASRPYREHNVCHTKMQPQAFYVNLVQAYNQLFWYKFKQTNGKLLWTVQFIGSPELANNYFFEIEAFKPGQPWRRYLMSEICQPDIDVEFLFKKSGTCVQSTIDAMDHFVTEDKLLIYYMRIKEMSSSIPDEMSREVDYDGDDARSCCSETSDRRRLYRGGQRKFYKKRGGANRQSPKYE